MNPPKEILQIPIEDIIPNRFQPRISFDEKALNDLAASIKQHGIIQPLVVRRLGEKYEIIAGERRYKAATMAGLTSVPAVITVIDDRTSAEVALVENIQRKDLTAIEEARSYKNLIDKNGMTQEELAKKMGLSQSAIANKLRLLNLSDKVQNALLNEQISERHARSLLLLNNLEEQDKWLDRILKERLTVRQLDTLLKSENVDEEDVPLVNMNQSVEDIKTNATDIIGITKEENAFEPEVKHENKFFNILEDEPVKMGPTSPGEKTPLPSFDIIKEMTTPAPEEIKLFDDVELLDISDISPQIVEENTETNLTTSEESLELTDIAVSSQKTEISDVINSIRTKVSELNSSGNIDIEELDLGDSYKINITIKKD